MIDRALQIIALLALAGLVLGLTVAWGWLWLAFPFVALCGLYLAAFVAAAKAFDRIRLW